MDEMDGNVSSTLPPPRIVWLDTLEVFTSFMISYFMVISLLFGTVGNIFSMVIFWLRRKQDRVSAAYLGPLAAFDLWNCANGWYHWSVQGLNTFSQGYLNVQHYAVTDLGCFAIVFSNQNGMCLSAWTIVIFTIERALVIHFPLKLGPKMTNSKRRNALIIMFIVVVGLNGICYVVEPYSVLGKNLCIPKDEYGPFIFWFFFTVVNGMYAPIPCALLLIFNIWIGIGVLRSKRMEKSSKSSSEDRALRNLIAVSTCYFIFSLPWSIFMGLGYTEFGAKSEAIGRLTLFAIAWANINFSINPLLYVWSLPYYRQMVVRVFCRCCRSNDDKNSSKSTITKSVTK